MTVLGKTNKTALSFMHLFPLLEIIRRHIKLASLKRVSMEFNFKSKKNINKKKKKDLLTF